MPLQYYYDSTLNVKYQLILMDFPNYVLCVDNGREFNFRTLEVDLPDHLLKRDHGYR